MTRLAKEQIGLAAEIKQLHSRRRPLNISAVREHNPHLLRAVYRLRPFWGWKRAIEAAGLDYSRIRIWVPEYIKCELCGAPLKTFGTHLKSIHGISVRKYRKEFPGAPLVGPAYRSTARCRRGASGEQARLRCIIPHWEPVWTPEYVLDRVSELHDLNHPLHPSFIEREECALYHWAQTFFKTWNTVLTAVGINPSEARLAAEKQTWTSRAVIAELRARAAHSEPLNWCAVFSENRSLINATLKHFGSYDRALKAARLDPSRIRKTNPRRRYKTPDDVIGAIHLRKLADKPLNHGALLEGKHRDIALYMKARRVFGTWAKTIEAAGLQYDKVRVSRNRYTAPESVLTEIKRRHSVGLPLLGNRLTSGPDRDANLYLQGKRFFRSWRSAIESAGIEYDSLRARRSKYPAKEHIIAEIQRRESSELPLNTKAMAKGPHADYALVMKATKTFGSWRSAIEAAGLDYDSIILPKRKYPDKNAVLEEIHRRSREGLPLNARAVSSADSALMNTACADFGSWKRAIRAAGIEYHKISRRTPRYRNRTAVRKEIERRLSAGLPLNATAVSDSDSPLMNQGRRLFGTWQKAVEAAGIDYDNVNMNVPAYRNTDDVIRELKRRYQAGLSVQTKNVRRGKHPDPTLYRVAGKLFPSWLDALRAAGIPENAVYPSTARYPSKESVLKELRRRHTDGLPVGSTSVRKKPSADTALYKSALKFFGCWQNATDAAGIQSSSG